MSEGIKDLQDIYQRRFARTAAYRGRVWRVLTSSFFNRWIDPNAAVLDLGCGYGEFINNIRAGRKWAMDLNPDAAAHLDGDVQFLEQDCSATWPLPDNGLDVVFTSNFFEHLPDKAILRRTLQQVVRCLRPGGRLIAVGPNIKYLPGRYWDFFDHHVMLTEASLSEALELEGLLPEKIVPRFLPYTLVGAPEFPLFMLRVYLAFPGLWWLVGRQFLVIARRPLARATG